MTQYFAGIGSRKAPPNILAIMTKITQELCNRGYTLRSGGAAGCDTAFQDGAPEDQMEIYLDAMHKRKQCIDGWYNVRYLDNEHEANEIAENHHPAWNKLGAKAKALISRNTYQVLGMDLNTPSEFVICWTPDGATTTTTRESGGTGQAIRLAHKRGIKVFNLQREADLQYILTWLEIQA